MIRLDKNDKKYVFVDYSDLMLGAVHASDNNKIDLANKYLKIFTDNKISKEHKVFNELKDHVKLRENSEEVKFLIEKVGIIDNRTYIDYNILKDALARSYYEFNHEMKNKLSSYFRKFVDNEINGISNTILIEEIINDKKLLEYIKKYDDFNEYLEDKINQNIEMNEKVKKRR